VSTALETILARNVALALAVSTAACAEAKKPDTLSLLSTLESMRPVVTCLGEAKQNDSKATEMCASNGGITLSRSNGEFPNLNDLKLQFLAIWMHLDRYPGRRMSTADFDSALDFARCIETASFADPDFSSKTEHGVAAARTRADAACREHPLSLMQVSPKAAGSEMPIENAAQVLLARSISGLSLNYALEANGWMTDAMRPCVRYLDGRPPSRGCKGKPQLKAFPPPPPPSMNR
jgi:hypothetical protein